MEHQEAYDELTRMQRIERGKTIIQQHMGLLSVRPYRTDGYVNVLNRFGTSKDSGEAYNFVQEPVVPDTELTIHYEDNGLFAKIIDTPAEEALKHGFDLNIKSETVQGFVDKALKALKFANKAATAIKWARLYGGSIIVMLIDDGRGLEEPLDWKNIRSIDELRVYERAVVQPDYASLYIQDPAVPGKNRTSKFGMPEFYDVHSLYGSFRVHESRCLVFRNGILPERVTNPVYRFWGTPEYVRIKRAMRDTLTTHGNGPKLLDRSVQPVYKMKDLAATLAAEGGDDIVMKRLELIDLARGILNSIAIDKDGEEYDFKSFTFTGVKDVIDASCNMLSAVTNIPQAILFGRSPAGENSTGESDFENYYNYVDKIRSLMLEDNLQYLLDILFYAGVANREVDEAPDYDLEFNPLWSLSETEQANVDKVKADTEFVRAQTAQLYVSMQAMDPSEVREALRRKEDFTVEEILDDQGEMEDWGLGCLEGPTGDLQLGQQTTPANPQDAIQTGSGGFGSTFPVTSSTNQADAMPTSAATLVVKDGKLLIGTRKDNALVCGPGGHIEEGETPEEAARREAMEEFGIRLGQLDCLGQIDGLPEEYGVPVIFLCTEFDGVPKADGKEMRNARFASLPELKIYQRFPPFKRSIELLESSLSRPPFESTPPQTVKNTDGVRRTMLTDEDNWITMNGTHVLVGEEGKVIGGPPNLKGKQHQPKKGSQQKSSKESTLTEGQKRMIERQRKMLQGMSPEEMCAKISNFGGEEFREKAEKAYQEGKTEELLDDYCEWLKNGYESNNKIKASQPEQQSEQKQSVLAEEEPAVPAPTYVTGPNQPLPPEALKPSAERAALSGEDLYVERMMENGLFKCGYLTMERQYMMSCSEEGKVEFLKRFKVSDAAIEDAIANGTVDKLLDEQLSRQAKKNYASYVKEAQKVTEKYDALSADMTEAQMAEREQKFVKKYGETQMTTDEFLELSARRRASQTPEEVMLEDAYINPDQGMRSGLSSDAGRVCGAIMEGVALTETQKEICDYFTRASEPIGRDVDLYRTVGADFITRNFSQELSSKALNGDMSGLVGKELVFSAPSSTAYGVQGYHAFANLPVIMKIRVPGTEKVFVTSNPGEGEIILPPGAKVKVTQAYHAESIKVPAVKSRRSNKSNTNDLGLYQLNTKGRDTGSERFVIEMELFGYDV